MIIIHFNSNQPGISSSSKEQITSELLIYDKTYTKSSS